MTANEMMDWRIVPANFPLCFNSECAQCGTCMHHRAAQLVPAALQNGPAVYPSAWAGDACSQYLPVGQLRYASGFGQLYNRLPSYFRSAARHRVTRYLGSVGTYYRYHYGERMLTPDQQRDIIDIVRELGPCDDAPFGHYAVAPSFG